MGESYRKGEAHSPKSSPRGAGASGGRSPLVARQDSSGTLTATISLGKNPSILHSGPFYLMKEPPCKSDKQALTGATNLMAYYGLEHSYAKFNGKKPKEQLSAFLPSLPGVVDGPARRDDSALRSVIDKPPICGKELLPLTNAQLAGFRLHPGPLPDRYRSASQAPAKRHRSKHKHKRHKEGGPPSQDAQAPDAVGQDAHENRQKHKKQKRHDDDKERKKRKKEKKRKKQKHSPEHPGGPPPSQHSNG